MNSNKYAEIENLKAEQTNLNRKVASLCRAIDKGRKELDKIEQEAFSTEYFACEAEKQGDHVEARRLWTAHKAMKDQIRTMEQKHREKLNERTSTFRQSEEISNRLRELA